MVPSRRWLPPKISSFFFCFWQFESAVPRCEIIYVYTVWDLLSLWNLQVDVFYQVQRICGARQVINKNSMNLQETLVSVFLSLYCMCTTLGCKIFLTEESSQESLKNTEVNPLRSFPNQSTQQFLCTAGKSPLQPRGNSNVHSLVTIQQGTDY